LSFAPVASAKGGLAFGEQWIEDIEKTVIFITIKRL
jgi:hypothetical protein